MVIACKPEELSPESKTEELLALPQADPLGAEILTKFYNLYSSADGAIDAGTWETAVGTSRWEFTDSGEVIYVLGGAMTVTPDGESPTVLTAGALAVFPPGWKGQWEVTEPLKKIYFIFAAGEAAA